jgi:CO/xanthine dehydrogenase FAD-binding subunit
VISIAMVAMVLETEGRSIRGARIAVGACSPVARRLDRLEKELEGAKLGPSLGQCVRPEHLQVLDPIDDVRASAEYRMHSALILVRRGLELLAEQE